MPRVNVYLSDDLHEEVKAAGIEVSAVCQSALRDAVSEGRQDKHQQLDVLTAVGRIALTARVGPLRHAEGRKAGLRWAMQTATLQDLQMLDDFELRNEFAYWTSDDGEGFSHLGLDDFETLAGWLAENLDDSHDFDGVGEWGIDEFTEGFFAAAKEFWAEAEPLLSEQEATRERRAAALRAALSVEGEAPF